MNQTFKDIIRYKAIAAIFLTLLVPLIVSTDLFFPFITGKAHLFRLLVLVASGSYLILWMTDKSYAPRKSVLLWSVLGFTAVLGIANFTSIDPFKSFWSNFERMEGYVTILHLFALFIVSSAVLRTKAMWATLFNMSMFVSVVVGIQGFMELGEKGGVFGSFRMSGPLGNSSYLGIYSLMHFFLAVFFIARLLKNTKLKDAPGRYLGYGAIGIFNLIVMYSTGTRGSFAGLVAGSIVATILIAIFEKKNVLVKKVSVGILIAGVAVVGLLGIFKEQPLIKNNDLLYRFSSLIVFSPEQAKAVLENQGMARKLIWGMAWEGVKERPILGWGQDNFGFVFAKYYDPAMYGQEQWFDRTHNVFMDWLIASGFLGLIAYLSLFATALYMIWRSKDTETEWNITERAILTAFLVAYFVHNIFVFDNLTSYILFFLLLGYISARHDGRSDNAATASAEPCVKEESVRNVLAGVVVVVFIWLAYVVVYKPYMAGYTLIQVLKANDPKGAQIVGPEKSSVEGRFGLFKKALAYNTLGNAEIEERLAEVASGLIEQSADKPELAAEINTLVAQRYEATFARNPTDPRPYIFFANHLNKLGLVEDALANIQKAVDLSPTKQSFLYQKGILEFQLKRNEDAIKTFKQAYDLYPENKEAKILYAMSLIYGNKVDEAKTLVGDDMSVWTEPRVLQTLAETNNYQIIVDIAKQKIAAEPGNAQNHVSLAGAYLKLKQPTNAIAEIRKAIEIAPEFKEQGEGYIKEIQAGRDPSESN